MSERMTVTQVEMARVVMARVAMARVVAVAVSRQRRQMRRW